MNDTKPLWQSKTLIGLAVALAGPWLARKFGLTLTDAAQQAIVEQIITGMGGALAVYGRLKADTALHIKPPRGPAAVAVLSALGLQLSGCAMWEGLSPGAQSALKGVAKAALALGVNQLTDRVKELQPFQGRLQAIIETTFAKVDGEANIGRALRNGVEAAVDDPKLRAAVFAEFKARLAPQSVAGPATAQEKFNAAVAGHL